MQVEAGIPLPFSVSHVCTAFTPSDTSVPGTPCDTPRASTRAFRESWAHPQEHRELGTSPGHTLLTGAAMGLSDGPWLNLRP